VRRLLLALVVASLISPAAAPAARQPTLCERTEIVNSYPAYLRSAPAECIYFEILVSTRDPRYARVVLQLINPMKQPCHRYWGNGYDVLKKTRGKWRTVWSGSTQPRCSQKIPRDIVRCSG